MFGRMENKRPTGESNLQSTCPDDRSDEKTFQQNSLYFLSGFEQKNPEASEKDFSAGLSKLPSTCPENQFLEIFFKNYGSRKRFRPLAEKVRIFCTIFSSRLANLLFTCPANDFEET